MLDIDRDQNNDIPNVLYNLSPYTPILFTTIYSLYIQSKSRKK